MLALEGRLARIQVRYGQGPMRDDRLGRDLFEKVVARALEQTWNRVSLRDDLVAPGHLLPLSFTQLNRVASTANVFSVQKNLLDADVRFSEASATCQPMRDVSGDYGLHSGRES